MPLLLLLVVECLGGPLQQLRVLLGAGMSLHCSSCCYTAERTAAPVPAVGGDWDHSSADPLPELHSLLPWRLLLLLRQAGTLRPAEICACFAHLSRRRCSCMVVLLLLLVLLSH